MPIQIEWHKVDSSNIDAIGIGKNDRAGQLFVRFNSGAEYVYNDVPADVAQGLLDADSKGKYLNENIKGRYNYRKEV